MADPANLRGAKIDPPLTEAERAGWAEAAKHRMSSYMSMLGYFNLCPHACVAEGAHRG